MSALLRTLLRVFIIAPPVAIMSYAALAAEATPEQVRQQLAATQAAIAEIDDWLTAANARQSGAEKRLQQASAKLDASNREAAELNAQARQLDARGAELREQRQNQQSIVQEREILLGEVLRALHKQGEPGAVRALLSGTDPADFSRQSLYLARISESHRQTLNAYRAELDTLSRIDAELAAQVQRLADTQAALAATQQQLSGERQEREAALAALVASVAQQRSEREQLDMDRAGVEQLLERVEAALRRVPAPPPGTRFAARKGSLPTPVNASIVRGYGSNAAGLPHHGITFAPTPNERVLAVHGGRVVFADWLRGAGLLVIIDHGDGFMTLYGNNESLSVTPGDAITAGTALALAGSGAAGGLYFEIRKDGAPTNPSAWLE